MAIHQPVIFLHIPKTAGLTLHHIIEAQYAPEAMFTMNLPEDLARYQELPEEAKRAIRIIRGHHGFGLHTMLPDATYFTILREPVDRVISFYYYAARTPGHYFGEMLKAQNWDLEQAIRNKATLELNNLQTRIIAGGGGFWGNDIVPYGEDAPEMLETAKQHLRDSFAVVGLTERFDESLILMRRAFGWRLPLYAKKNVTKNRPAVEDIPPGALETIKAYNALDIELYGYIEDLFRAQLSRAGIGARLEARTYTALNDFRAGYQGSALQKVRVWLNKFGI